jgi:hypothetical protein
MTTFEQLREDLAKIADRTQEPNPEDGGNHLPWQDVPATIRAHDLTPYESAQDAEIAALQAKIDALMLEYCPSEMTPEQMAEWERHQKRSGATGSIDSKLSGGRMNSPRTDERDPEQIRLFKKLDNAVRKAAVAHDEMVAAQTRAHDLKLRVKSEHGAVLSLQRELSESQAKLREAMLLNVDVAKQCGHAMGRAEAAEARAVRMEKALRSIKKVMGPRALPCSGCEYEWNHALEIARAALK